MISVYRIINLKSRHEDIILLQARSKVMKTIGLLGGMSWESTLGYYREINQGVKEKLGGLHSARIVMVSVDFEPIEKMQCSGDWKGTATLLSEAAQQIQAAGADFFLICTNTMHKVANEVEASVNIPLLHIADATAQTLIENRMTRVGLLGTGFTMEQDFYKGRLKEQYGLEVLIPDNKDRQMVHDVIYKELCLGRIKESSKQAYIEVIQKLSDQGAQAVILGCTEIGMLVKQADTPVKLVDTTAIHAQKAVAAALDSDAGKE